MVRQSSRVRGGLANRALIGRLNVSCLLVTRGLGNLHEAVHRVSIWYLSSVKAVNHIKEDDIIIPRAVQVRGGILRSLKWVVGEDDQNHISEGRARREIRETSDGMVARFVVCLSGRSRGERKEKWKSGLQQT